MVPDNTFLGREMFVLAAASSRSDARQDSGTQTVSVCPKISIIHSRVPNPDNGIGRLASYSEATKKKLKTLNLSWLFF
jgi:hypothetical protein